MKKAKDYVDHILAAQDADGYLGIFSPELRYQGHGELWTQTCLFRGLLAYADATGDAKVFAAVQARRGPDHGGLCGLPANRLHPARSHVHRRSGTASCQDRREEIPRFRTASLPRMSAPESVFANSRDAGSPVGQRCSMLATAAAMERRSRKSMRLPFWFWNATGDEEFLRQARGVVSAMDHWMMPSGALVSMESVDRPPQPWDVGYEYCTIFERESTLLAPRSRNWATPPTPTRSSISGSTPPRVPGFPNGRGRALLFRGKPPVGP